MLHSQQKPGVYMVDDDRDLVEELAELVSRHGFQVKHFTKPETALRAMTAQRAPFIVVTDVMMPGMTGHQLLERLQRQAVPSAPYEVIMMSGQAEFDNAVRAMELGVLDFIPKPVDAKALLQSLGLATEKLAERMKTDRRVGLLEAKLAETAKATQSMAENIKNLLTTDLSELAQPKPVAATGTQQSEAPAASKVHVLEKAPTAEPVDVDVSSPHQMLTLIKLLQSIKRVRDKHFTECAQGDAEWEIILYVLEQDLLNRAVSVTSACHATLIPQTTAMRKIDELVSAGLLERHADPDDRRRILVSPTNRTRNLAEEVLGSVLTQTLGAVHPEGLQSAKKSNLREAAE